jgi:hypothetical protein
METFRFTKNFEIFKSDRLTFEKLGIKAQALTSKNRTLKQFDLSLKKKLSLLKDQSNRVERASLKLHSHLKFKMISKYQLSLKKKLENLQTQSAIKIQKCFRGFLARKKFADLSLGYRKSLVLNKIEDLRNSVSLIFLHSKATEEVTKK